LSVVRFVFAFSYIAAVGVLCTPTIEQPHLLRVLRGLCG